VPHDRQQSVIDLFHDEAEVSRRPSRNGRYVGLTFIVPMESSKAVIDIYREAAALPGVITL
ncbi:MAG: DUF493 family protein, partial [Catalinimonas sp.]